MKKFTFLLFILPVFFFQEVNAQFAADGLYLWNSTSLCYSANKKTELVLSNKDHFSNQIDHLDYFHFELTAYRALTTNFQLGLGYRQTESYKTSSWSPGSTYLFYTVYNFHPADISIRFANRLAVRTYKISDTQYTFDNITNVDFFAHSTSKIPKPFLNDEIFTNLNHQKVQTIRLYTGLHLLKFQHLAFDLYYCYQKTRPSWEWKNYNIWGISTKFRI
ncbi:MAG: DUF2490 domain-containing protein [Prolixibacteraceae bacterium]